MNRTQSILKLEDLLLCRSQLKHPQFNFMENSERLRCVTRHGSKGGVEGSVFVSEQCSLQGRPARSGPLNFLCGEGIPRSRGTRSGCLLPWSHLTFLPRWTFSIDHRILHAIASPGLTLRHLPSRYASERRLVLPEIGSNAHSTRRQLSSSG